MSPGSYAQSRQSHYPLDWLATSFVRTNIRSYASKASGRAVWPAVQPLLVEPSRLASVHRTPRLFGRSNESHPKRAREAGASSYEWDGLRGLGWCNSTQGRFE